MFSTGSYLSSVFNRYFWKNRFLSCDVLFLKKVGIEVEPGSLMWSFSASRIGI